MYRTVTIGSLLLVLLTGVAAQTEPDTTRNAAVSNAYIHEDWSYFAEHNRNEFVALAEKRYRRGQWESALIEYFNFVFHFPDDPLAPMVRYRIGRCYERLEGYDQAREQYELVRGMPGTDPRLQVVCLRQLAKMDYTVGDLAKVRDLPPMDDPYILVLKGYASLTEEHWMDADSLFKRARRYYPSKGRLLLDSLIVRVEQTERLPYRSASVRVIFNFIPGLGTWYSGDKREAIAYAGSAGFLMLGALQTDNWMRYALGAGAGIVWVGGFRSSGRIMDAYNRALLLNHLEQVRGTFEVDLFWSFAHPAIY